VTQDKRKYIHRKLLCQGYRFKLYRDQIPWKGSRKVYREWALRPDVCAILPLVSPAQIILVRQYRHGVHRYLWEVPAGALHSNESVLSGAKRECEEETGFKPLRMKKLGTFFPVPAYDSEKVHCFLATNLKQTQKNFDYDENIRLGFFSKQDVKQMLKKGRIQDAKSQICLYHYFAI
jgi:ADP-ribose pyrophosphatase